MKKAYNQDSKASFIQFLKSKIDIQTLLNVVTANYGNRINNMNLIIIFIDQNVYFSKVLPKQIHHFQPFLLKLLGNSVFTVTCLKTTLLFLHIWLSFQSVFFLQSTLFLLYADKWSAKKRKSKKLSFHLFHGLF